MAKATYIVDSAFLPPSLLLPEVCPDLIKAMHPRHARPGSAAATIAAFDNLLTA